MWSALLSFPFFRSLTSSISKWCVTKSTTNVGILRRRFSAILSKCLFLRTCCDKFCNDGFLCINFFRSFSFHFFFLLFSFSINQRFYIPKSAKQSTQATNIYCSNAVCTLCASFDDIFSQFITIMIRISRFSMCKCMNSFFVCCYFSSFFVVVLFFHNLWRIFTHE